MHPSSIRDSVTLNNGVQMPWLGLGTWQSASGSEVETAVRDAFTVGYRHIDTATFYQNEASIGKAVRESGLKRDEVFITTKVWNSDLRTGNTAGALEESLRKLAMNHVDLFLIHWPVKGKFAEAWRTCEILLKQGRARAIGVSNFLEHHLDELAKVQSVMPAVNQIEWHPWLQSKSLVKRCERDGIVVEAWSPLMQGKIRDVPELATIGKAHGKSPAQVAIRWGLQKGIVMIPKSVRRERIAENAGAFDFDLSADEIAKLDSLDRGHRIGPDPDTFSL